MKVTKEEEAVERYFMIFDSDEGIIGIYPYKPLKEIYEIKEKVKNLKGVPLDKMDDLERDGYIKQLKQDRTNHFIVVS